MKLREFVNIVSEYNDLVIIHPELDGIHETRVETNQYELLKGKHFDLDYETIDFVSCGFSKEKDDEYILIMLE